MNRDVLALVSRQKPFLKICLLSLFVASGVFILRGSSNLDRIGVVKDGTATCFQRVLQSYTAHLIQSTNSSYLSSSFMNSTEECLGEAVYQAVALGLNALNGAVKGLNNLASNTHWFHEQLEGGQEKVMESGVTLSQIGERFRNLESIRNNIYSYFDLAAKEVRGTAEHAKIIFYTSAFFLFLIFAGDIVKERREHRRRKRLESGAENLLEEQASSQSIEQLIFDALSSYKLLTCSKLYEKYRMNQTLMSSEDESKSQTEKDKESVSRFPYGKPYASLNDHAGRPVIVSPQEDQGQRESKIEQAWTDWNEPPRPSLMASTEQKELSLSGEVKEAFNNCLSTVNIPTSTEENEIEDSFEGVHLDFALAQLVGRFSETFFSKGISLDLDVDEQIYIDAENEAIEHILHHLMSGVLHRMRSVSRDSSKTTNPKVSLKLKRNGPSVVLEMKDTGLSLSEDVLYGTEKGAPEVQASLLEYRICRELMDEVCGQIKIQNNSDLNITKLFFKAKRNKSVSVEPKLVDVKKGTKKDLMKELKKPFSQSTRA